MPTFSRQERLKSRKTISQLFKGGNSFVAYPLRVVWLLTEGEKAREGERRREGEKAREGERRREGEKAREEEKTERDFPAQVAISVSKKFFKTAVERNLIKRRIREAYRLNKADFYEKLGERQVALMLVFIDKEALPFAEIEAGVKKMIRKFPE